MLGGAGVTVTETIHLSLPVFHQQEGQGGWEVEKRQWDSSN